MLELSEMTNLQLQDSIFYEIFFRTSKTISILHYKISDDSSSYEIRKEFEKELINKVLTDLSSKALSYTVQDLDQLRTQFNNKLLELNSLLLI